MHSTRQARPRALRSRVLAALAVVPVALTGALVGADRALAAPGAGASASPGAVPRYGESTVTLALDGENSTQSTPTDLVLVLDESGSISSAEFNQLRSFADDVVEAVAADGLFTHGGRIGVVGFSGSAHVVAPLLGDETAVRNAIATNPQSGGNTCIACGLDQANALLTDPPGRNQLVIVITDGNATHGDTFGAASALQSGATVFAVGVGDGVHQSTLNVIASGSADQNTFSAADFAQLETLLEAVVAAVVVPGATNPAVTVSLAPGWDLVPGSVSATLGAITGEHVDGFSWGARELGDEDVVMTYRVRHEGAPCGLLPVNQSVTYSDDQGATVTFPDVSVRVDCAPPTADAGPDVSIPEGSSTTLDGSGSFDLDGSLTGFAWSGADPMTGTFSAASGPMVGYEGRDDGIDDVLLEVTDDNGLVGSDITTVTVTNVAPALTLTSCPVDPTAVGSAVSIAGSFTDPGTADTHTMAVDWGDGTVTPASSASSPVSATHTYGAAGVYDIGMTVTDDDGGASTQTCGFVVVYDPDGGFVTGGGRIHSPAGAYPADPGAEGPANFGFVSKYKRGASVPTGSTEFQFKAGNLNFHSNAYQWLVVAGSKAQYKGTGTINGAEGYGFMLTATDGSPDRLRMKIWRTADDTVVYDNQIGASDTSDPTTALTGGSIVIHKG